MSRRLLRNQVRELRQQGQTISKIVELTGVRKHTVKAWDRDIVLSSQQLARLQEENPHYAAQLKGAYTIRENFRELRRQYQEAGRIKARQRKPSHLVGCIGLRVENFGIIFTLSIPTPT